MINFRQVRLKRLRTPYDANEWPILHNIASTGPVWPLVGNGGQQWSRDSSFKELVHFKSELWDLGLVYQVIACTTLWDKISRIWYNVAYSGPVFVTVSRYDRLRPILSLYYLFWTVLTDFVSYDYIKFQVPGKHENGQKWSIIIQNVLS